MADPVRLNPMSQVYVATLPSLTPLDRDRAPLTGLDSCPQVETIRYDGKIMIVHVYINPGNYYKYILSIHVNISIFRA